MKFLIVSASPVIFLNNEYSAYSPYVREIIIWEKYVDKVAFCCPIRTNNSNLLRSNIPFTIDKIFQTKESNLKSVSNALKSIFISIYNVFIIFKAMYWADHIHLRCPGNIGLLGCILQIFFPFKPKTAKYAGNWDPNAKQPWSYKLQKWILSNTFLTKNIEVLVYGEWQNSSKNITPFFTATYYENDKKNITKTDFSNSINFIYVGTLTSSKNCIYAVKLIEGLSKQGYNVRLRIFGEGEQKSNLNNYIKDSLSNSVFLEGNRSIDIIKEAYINSHFVILPSKSEGWPKVIAEGMFWKCVPIASNVSCISNMLDNGKRGVILKMDINSDVEQIKYLIANKEEYNRMSEESSIWSRKFTLDYFENQIKLILDK